MQTVTKYLVLVFLVPHDRVFGFLSKHLLGSAPHLLEGVLGLLVARANLCDGPLSAHFNLGRLSDRNVDAFAIEAPLLDEHLLANLLGHGHLGVGPPGATVFLPLFEGKLESFVVSPTKLDGGATGAGIHTDRSLVLTELDFGES